MGRRVSPRAYADLGGQLAVQFGRRLPDVAKRAVQLRSGGGCELAVVEACGLGQSDEGEILSRRSLRARSVSSWGFGGFYLGWGAVDRTLLVVRLHPKLLLLGPGKGAVRRLKQPSLVGLEWWFPGRLDGYPDEVLGRLTVTAAAIADGVDEGLRARLRAAAVWILEFAQCSLDGSRLLAEHPGDPFHTRPRLAAVGVCVVGKHEENVS